MQAEDPLAELKQRVNATQMGETVSEEDMRPLLTQSYAVGAKIERLRPEVPASAQKPKPINLAPMVFKLTPQGWERVPRSKPGCMTPVVAWALGGLVLLRQYGSHHATEGPNADQTNQEMQVLMVFICFLAGLIMWWWDWWQYKSCVD